MNFLELAKSRYSVRQFEDRPLSQEDIDKLLLAAQAAPTGRNNQPQRILVINSDEAVDKLKNCTKCHFGARTAMLVCFNKDESWVRPFDGELSAPVDASIVTTHIMLMAQSIGVGTCWVMFFDPDKTREEFAIPENLVPLALLVMGYPHKDAKPSERHSVRKDIDEFVVYNSFS
ncbi:MAG: nitroreductase [Clostridiales bacterium]|nr:nitroreductase [Clostridiales bacterium]